MIFKDCKKKLTGNAFKKKKYEGLSSAEKKASWVVYVLHYAQFIV